MITKDPLGMLHQMPDPKLPKTAALVYQLGYAFVCQVEKNTGKPDQPISRLAKDRGRTHLLLKSSFLEAFRFAQGLATAGWTIETFTVSFPADDITATNWSRKYEENTYYPMMERRILWPGGINAETKEERLARMERHVELTTPERKKKR